MGLFGDDEFDKDAADSDLSLEALKKILGQEPDALQLGQYTPEKFQDAGTYDPRLVTTQDIKYDPLGNSAMENVSTDPRLRDAQMSALTSLQDISKGGLTAQDKADLARIQSTNNQQDKGRRDAILMNNQARGMGGSGQELLAQLSSSQAATDRQAQQGLDIEGMAQQRALAALSQAGVLGGNMRGQEFDEKSKVATAKDAVDRFNSANTWQGQQFNANQNMQGQQFNAGAGNTAAALGIHNKQGTMDNNTNAGNNAQKFNKFEVPMAMHTSQVDAYGHRVNGATKIADIAAQRAGQSAQSGAATTSAVVGGAGTGAATGAMVGGPWGAVAGGVIGGVGGYMASKSGKKSR